MFLAIILTTLIGLYLGISVYALIQAVLKADFSFSSYKSSISIVMIAILLACIVIPIFSIPLIWKKRNGIKSRWHTTRMFVFFLDAILLGLGCAIYLIADKIGYDWNIDLYIALELIALYLMYWGCSFIIYVCYIEIIESWIITIVLSLVYMSLMGCTASFAGQSLFFALGEKGLLNIGGNMSAIYYGIGSYLSFLTVVAGIIIRAKELSPKFFIAMMILGIFLAALYPVIIVCAIFGFLGKGAAEGGPIYETTYTIDGKDVTPSGYENGHQAYYDGHDTWISDNGYDYYKKE